MSEIISKTKLINAIAEKERLTKKQVGTVVNALVSEISSGVADGKRVQLPGFGTFERRSRKARNGTKPGTGERIKIPASNFAAFKPGKTFKALVRGN